MEPLPLILVTGFAGGGKSSVIADWLNRQPEKAHWLGFSNADAMKSESDRGSSKNDSPKCLFSAPLGCLHCIGLLPTQVALTRALGDLHKRQITPNAVFLEAAADGHTELALAALKRPPLSVLVRLGRVVAVFNPAWLITSSATAQAALDDLAAHADVLLANHWATCEDDVKGARTAFVQFAEKNAKPWFSADFGRSEYLPL